MSAENFTLALNFLEKQRGQFLQDLSRRMQAPLESLLRSEGNNLPFVFETIEDSHLNSKLLDDEELLRYCEVQDSWESSQRTGHSKVTEN